MAQALHEISLIDRYDYVVINDQLTDAVADFADIVATAQAAAADIEDAPVQAHLRELKEKSDALKAMIKKEFLL